MLPYHCGFFGAPPIDATSAYSPSCSTRISAVLRRVPLLLPRVVTMTMGNPVSSKVLASRPPERSYCSTWSRTHCHGLGTYSPSSATTWILRRMTDSGCATRDGNRCCVRGRARDVGDDAQPGSRRACGGGREGRSHAASADSPHGRR